MKGEQKEGGRAWRGETAERREESLRGKSRFVEAIEEGWRKSRSQVSMEANEILGMIKAGKAC